MTGDNAPPSSLQGREAEHGATASGACDWCGEPFDRSRWHYPGVDYGPNGDVLVYVFCTRQCRARWEHEGEHSPAERESRSD